MRRIVCALGLAVSLAATTSTAAAQSPAIFAGERAASPTVIGLTKQAIGFWAARNVTGHSAIDVRQAPALRYDDGLEVRGAAIPGTVWIADWLVGATDRAMVTIDSLRTLCATVTHETGHALGLDHTLTGVMASVSGTVPVAWVPWFCRVWARRRIERLFPDG